MSKGSQASTLPGALRPDVAPAASPVRRVAQPGAAFPHQLAVAVAAAPPASTVALALSARPAVPLGQKGAAGGPDAAFPQQLGGQVRR